MDVRLGGIYALEQIAKESKELHGPVMEILTAFLREHSPQLRREELDQLWHADFQAIATVLGRRQVSHEPPRFRLDLRGVALAQVSFVGAQLDNADFSGAWLRGADFLGAHLREAIFCGAQLDGAGWSMASEAEHWSAQVFGAGSDQHRWHVAFAAHRCPKCGGPLVSLPDSPVFRRCRKCKLSWFAQHSEPDGSRQMGLDDRRRCLV